MSSRSFETRSRPSFDSCAPAQFELSVLPIYVARAPAAPFSSLPSRLCLDHSHCPVLVPGRADLHFLAALPSTRAIPNRDVFYVAFPKRSIPSLATCSMSLILSAPFKADLAPDDKRFIAHCKWLLSQNCGLRPTLPRRRPIKVEGDNAGGVVERVRNDRDPQIATGGEKDEPHGEADRSGEQHAERVLVGVRQSEQCRLNHTRDAPSQFAPAEKQGQPLK